MKVEGSSANKLIEGASGMLASSVISGAADMFIKLNSWASGPKGELRASKPLDL
jgi:hypothetical protein